MSCLKRTNVTLEHQRKSWSLGFPVLTRGPDKSSDTVSPSPYIFIYSTQSFVFNHHCSEKSKDHCFRKANYMEVKDTNTHPEKKLPLKKYNKASTK